MSQHDEINIAALYNGEPAGTPQQEAAKLAMQRERRANLPKFKLAPGERFYIPREKLIETQKAYYQILDDQRKGTVNASEDMRSYMESVLFEAYCGEIEKLQEEYSIDGLHKDYIHAIKKDMMTPCLERKGFFRRKKPNYALKLCQKEAALESEVDNSTYRETIARQEIVLYGAFEAVFEELEETTLASVRKKKRYEINAILQGIQDAYEQRNFEQLSECISALEIFVPQAVLWKKRRAEIYEHIGRLIDCCVREQKHEIEERKARTSDITVLRYIAEILKCKRGVPELPAPQPEAPEEPVPPDYDSQSSEGYFVSPEEADELEAAMLDALYSNELDELYELEDEFDESGEAENEESEEDEGQQIEMDLTDDVSEGEGESEELEADELEDGE